MFPYTSIWAAASNVKGGRNPPFTPEDFKAMYPQFFLEDGPLVPEPYLQSLIEMADASVKESRYHRSWKYCMCLYIAHFLTLYLRTTVSPEAVEEYGPGAVAGAGEVKGIATSKSVDGVSVSYDVSQAAQDMEGWGSWKETEYGRQFVTMAKMYGKGGMAVP